jgi:predicted HAD superfamily Cof-like phosphohydrolase
MPKKHGSVSRPAQLVLEFYGLVGKPIRDSPTASIPDSEKKQVSDLLFEELGELRTGIVKSDIKAIADALADIVYVAYGAALQFGIDLDDAFEVVHAANMSKPNADGSVRMSSTGKILKGDRYLAPDLSQALHERPEPESRADADDSSVDRG